MINGTLFQLTRRGEPAGSCTPLASAIVEFRCGALCVFVREQSQDLLPGIPNLYCVDSALRLQWIAEWPDACGPCIRILDATETMLEAESESGAIVRLDCATGRLLGVDQLMSAAG